jgi:L-alanine-DL-glutamate epimerase-like enolase superfamily enzyme
MKCGGITPAKRMIAEAKKLNLKIMVGCMTESSVGISAIAQLAPLLDYVDMDGALLLSNDPAKGVELINGEIVFNNQPGIGASLR